METAQSLLYQAPMGVAFLRPNGTVDLWNPLMTQILGWSEQEVLGRSSPVVFQAGENLSLTRKDGTPVPVHVSVVKDQGTTVVMVVDFSAQKERVRFRELLEAAPDAIIEVDRQGRIVLMNRVT